MADVAALYTAGALKSHYKGSELDLGPDPADEKAAPPTPAQGEEVKANGAATAAEKEVVGLPS